MKATIRHLGVFLLWNLVAGGILFFVRPAAALPVSLGLTALFFWGYILRPPRGIPSPEHWSTLRLRPLHGDALRWSLLAIPVLLLLSWAIGEVYGRFVMIPPETLNPFEPIMRTAEGRLVIAIFAIGIAPILEEFVFRGLIQREIERRRGPATGILVAAALFAAVHMLPWVFPLHFILGAAFGFAVYATRSIWTGVMLHAANNIAALLGTALSSDEEHLQTIWEVGITPELWISVVLLLVSIPLAVWTARKLLEAGRAQELPAW